MRVLFIARRFPPSVGGMERFAYDLYEALSADNKMRKITWGGSNKWLPFVIPLLFLRGAWAVITDRSIRIIHIQDAMLAPIGWVLCKLSGKPFVVIAHGLDITYKNRLYQKVIPWFLRRSGAVVSISQATTDEVCFRGISKEKAITIPLGITDDTNGVKDDRGALSKHLGLDLENKKILITVGRLVKRKGVAWFIENIMTEISKDPELIYLIAGDGTERDTIKSMIGEKGLEDKVFLLGKIDEETKLLLYKSSDIFIMPNIKVSGDMEGFGRVAHEAAVAELPVVASDLEGIKEAVVSGSNGFLINPGDKKEYIRQIGFLLRNDKERNSFGKKARDFTLKNYSWGAIASRYLDVYKKLV